MTRALELRQKRAHLADEARKLIPADGVKMSGEDRRKFDLIMGEVDELKKEIDKLERADDARGQLGALDRELRETTRPREAQLGGDGYEEALDSSSERRYRKAFSNFLRQGMQPTERGGRGLDDEDRAIVLSRNSERRDMGVGTGAGGGYVVPQGFVYQIESAMKYYGPMLQSSTTMDTDSGQPLPWANDNDTTNTGEQIAREHAGHNAGRGARLDHVQRLEVLDEARESLARTAPGLGFRFRRLPRPKIRAATRPNS